MYLDGASEAEIDDPNFTGQPPTDEQDGPDDDGQYESNGEDGSPSSRGGSRMSSEQSPQSPYEEMLSLPSLASPSGVGYSEDSQSGAGSSSSGGGIGYKQMTGFRPVGADPRDSKNPLSITSLTASFGAREQDTLPGAIW